MMKQLVLLVLMITINVAYAQEDLLELLNDEMAVAETKVTSTFKGSRLISGQTVRTLKGGTMDFVISHRFGRVNDGINEFYGLDDSQIRLALEFGITNDLTFGFGRSSNEKVVDSFLKYKILAQRTSGMPVTVTAFTSIAIKTGPGAFTNPEFDNQFSQRLHFSYQLLIARKFSPSLSLQIMPTLIHRNLVATPEHPNDIIAVGAGGRFKLTKRMSFNAEYYPQITDKKEFTNALSFGIDLETGGHVFQIHVTNSRAMIEEGFVAGTTGDWANGDLHLGFNISRSFNIKSKKNKEILKDW